MTRQNKMALIYVVVLLLIAIALICSAKAAFLPERSDLELLACVIYQEGGGDSCSDLCRYMIGDVVLNRVADPRFPDTIEGVLLQDGQYVARAYAVARDLLAGNHSPIFGKGYVWQSDVEQGTSSFEIDGIVFGKGDAWR